MDDGYFNTRDKTITLCTDSFTPMEIDNLISVLECNFNLGCRTERKNDKFRIVIRGSSLPKVIELTQPFFHSSMLYKLGL